MAMRTLLGMFLFAFSLISSKNVKWLILVVVGQHACMLVQEVIVGA